MAFRTDRKHRFWKSEGWGYQRARRFTALDLPGVGWPKPGMDAMTVIPRALVVLGCPGFEPDSCILRRRAFAGNRKQRTPTQLPCACWHGGAIDIPVGLTTDGEYSVTFCNQHDGRGSDLRSYGFMNSATAPADIADYTQMSQRSRSLRARMSFSVRLEAGRSLFDCVIIDLSPSEILLKIDQQPLGIPQGALSEGTRADLRITERADGPNDAVLSAEILWQSGLLAGLRILDDETTVLDAFGGDMPAFASPFSQSEIPPEPSSRRTTSAA